MSQSKVPIEVHLLLEEPTRPVRIEATLTILKTGSGYRASTLWGDRFDGLGETPRDAVLDYLRKTLESIHAFDSES